MASVLLYSSPPFVKAMYSFISSRRFLARALSTVLCSILVVFLPFSRFGGQSAFLAITIKELVFSAQENLPQQIEGTVLHLVGGLVGVALSSFGKFLASLTYNRIGDAPLTRCIPALTLAFICFSAGWLKSRLPRLTFASRIACFVSIWLLTSDITSQQRIRGHALEFVWMVVVAATTSLFSCMIILKWSSTRFAVELAKALSELHNCLHSSLEEHGPDNVSGATPNLSYIAPTELLKRSISLDTLYQQASFELRVGRVSVKLLKPLIMTVEHLRRILSRRLVIPGPSPETEETSVVEAFHKPALELGIALSQSMKAIEEQVLACYHSSSIGSERKPDIPTSQTRLSRAVNTAKEHLQQICDDLDAQKWLPSGDAQFPSKTSDSCACMIFLLQMAQELQFGLRVMQEIRECHDKSKPRLWHPRPSLAWLGVTPSMVSTDEAGTFLDENTLEIPNLLSEPEALQGIAEHTYNDDRDNGYIKNLTTKEPRITGRRFSARWFRSLVYSTWNHPKALKARMRLSRFLKALEGSPHIRHAFKNGVGVALLSLPAFLADDAPGRKWFLSSYGQWMIISYVWVLETNTGATLRVAYLRLCGTILGATYAYTASSFCKSNAYVLVAMVTLAELPISWIIMNTTISPMGTVAAITLPPILFTPYFRPHEEVSTWRMALLRAALISLGIVAALLVNSLLFPRHCRVLFLNTVCRTLGLSNQLLMNMGRDLFHHTPFSAVHKKRNYKLEREIRDSLHRLAILLKTMDDEASLVPKPMKRYRQILNVLHQLSNLLTSLRKVGQHIPKKEVVTAVSPQRRELVSCICIGLFASEQVFRARQPLPQFLPSSRIAFIALEREVEEQILQSYQGEHESLGLSLIYVFAELDLLAELVDTMDGLVELTRHLFGTSSWLKQLNPTPMGTSGITNMHEESM
ncbi:hypothetical protein P691DRAFT_724576 [Macrolepiota fuliginosa MF-IS2]|uniref:Integral membrane bound transporter domain-containing protein n=1 Tax=Macrolepiota fuliginosa MF-IS2 TaxID=1400762 RepID=A0A9P6C7E4_9AGAR|nr:hypothetical protein P691DRAFT_724576 [Macrolepiota fuliginosa MF-IS2]